MSHQPLSARLALALAVLVPLLAGCAAAGGAHSHDAATGAYGASAGRGAMGGPQAGMDMQSMCEMHKRMMAGKSPAERQAMIDEQMKSMAPEMRAQARQMMENCR